MPADAAEPEAGLAWYAAYGSNLSRARFQCYLTGSMPEGASRAGPGSADPSPPLDDRPLRIARRIVFAGHSSRWDGGVAFLRDDDGPTLGRMYLVTVRQFSDVLTQENGGTVAQEIVDVGSIEASGGLDLPTGWYRRVVSLGTTDGWPVLTITGAPDGPDAPPSPAYLRHMRDGLVESHGMDVSAVVAYLASIPGAPQEGAIREALG